MMVIASPYDSRRSVDDNISKWKLSSGEGDAWRACNLLQQVQIERALDFNSASPYDSRRSVDDNISKRKLSSGEVDSSTHYNQRTPHPERIALHAMLGAVCSHNQHLCAAARAAVAAVPQQHECATQQHREQQ
jgi:hypothetical protein